MMKKVLCVALAALVITACDDKAKAGTPSGDYVCQFAPESMIKGSSTLHVKMNPESKYLTLSITQMIRTVVNGQMSEPKMTTGNTFYARPTGSDSWVEIDPDTDSTPAEYNYVQGQMFVSFGDLKQTCNKVN